MTLYIHIGLHKTGSSAIQHCLYNANRANPVYLNLGMPNQSQLLYTIFASSPEQYHIWQNQGISQDEVFRIRNDYRRQLEKQLSRLTGSAIISGEDLANLAPDEVQHLHDYFQDHFDDVKVIAYVRDPLQFAKSNFSELLKHNVPLSEQINPAYQYKLEKYLMAFGRESMWVFNYDDCLKDYGSVVTHFLEVIDCRGVKTEASRENVSLSFEALKYLNLFNQAIPVSDRVGFVYLARTKLIIQLDRLYQDYPKLKGDDVRELADYSDSEWLSEQFGIDYRPDDSTIPTGLPERLKSFEPESLEILRSYLQTKMSIHGEQFDARELITLLWYDVLVEARNQAGKNRFQRLMSKVVGS